MFLACRRLEDGESIFKLTLGGAVKPILMISV